MREKERDGCRKDRERLCGDDCDGGGGGGEMESTFDIETLPATISSGKKEGINGVLSISNWPASVLCSDYSFREAVVAETTDHSLTKRYIRSLTRPFYLTRARKGEGRSRAE